MERCELRQGAGGDFVKPCVRKFLCPDCRKLGNKKVILVDKRCPECEYIRGTK